MILIPQNQTTSNNDYAIGKQMLAPQVDHDSIVRFADSQFIRENTSGKIYVNTTKLRRYSISGRYPDILIADKDGKYAQFIIEIETSLVDTQAMVGKWREYAKSCEALYLVVPRKQLSKAKRMCRKYDINSRFGCFDTNTFGKITKLVYNL